MLRKTAIGLLMAVLLALGMTGCNKASNTPQVPLQPEIAPEGQVGKYSYSVEKNSGYFQKSETAGYYVDTLDQPNAPYFVVITSGKKRTSGYGIEVTGIDLDEADNMTITVQFTEPDPKEKVSRETTYPYTMVYLDRLPSGVTVETTDGSTLKWLQ